MPKVNPYIVFDFETGGLDPKKHAATEIAMLCIDGSTLQEVGRYESYISPYLFEYQKEALNYTGITMEKLDRLGKPLKQVVKEIVEWVKEMRVKTDSTSYTKKPILVGHNPLFDIGFLQQIFKEAKEDATKLFDGKLDFNNQYQFSLLDTIVLSKLTWANDEVMNSFNLGSCVGKAGIEIVDAHKAINDVVATKELLITLVNRLRSNTGTSSGDRVRLRDKPFFQL
jgi:DNA polymerase-3 subunit epsilon